MIGGAALLWAALWSPAGQAPLVVDLGCGMRRASDVSIASRPRSLTVKTRCIADTGSDRMSTIAAGFRLPAATADRRWFAALGPAAPVRAVASRQGRNQSITLTLAGGAPCLTVTIVPLVAQPLPPQFLGSDGDWQATTDILATGDCGAVAVRAGNRIALFAPARFDTIRAGGFRIDVRRGTADGDDQRNAHHHGRGRG